MLNTGPGAEERFVEALEAHASLYGVSLNAPTIATLRGYFEVVQVWNPRLHLVAPCSPKEFATRHVLESLFAAQYIDEGALIADIGSGAGLPIVPCLIARPDIRAMLYESSPKKAVFLREGLRVTLTSDRAEVIAERFELSPAPQASVITCRALDRFTDLLPKILAWAPEPSSLILFGGPSLQKEIHNAGLAPETIRIPESKQRIIYIVKKVQGSKFKIQS